MNNEIIYDETIKGRVHITSSESKILSISRFAAQGNLEIEKKDVVSIVNGQRKVTQKKAITASESKTIENLILCAQNSSLGKTLEYKRLRNQAIQNLKPRFQKYGFPVYDTDIGSSTPETLKKREYAIQEQVNSIVENAVTSLDFELTYNEFIKGLGPNTRTKSVLSSLLHVANKNFFSWTHPQVSENFKEVKSVHRIVNFISSIDVVFSTELSDLYEKEHGKLISLKEFCDLTHINGKPIKNKKKHIEAIRFSVPKQALPYIFGVKDAKNRVELDTVKRNSMSLESSRVLDRYVESIIAIRHLKQFTDFNIPDWQKKFGVNYSRDRDFISKVINPGILEFNKIHAPNITLSFVSQPKKKYRLLIDINNIIQGKKRWGCEYLSYYIASRMYYYDTYKIQSLEKYTKSINKKIKESIDEEETYIPTSNILFHKSIAQWRIEAEINEIAEKLCLEVLSLLPLSEDLLSFDFNKLAVLENNKSLAIAICPYDSLVFLINKYLISNNSNIIYLSIDDLLVNKKRDNTIGSSVKEQIETIINYLRENKNIETKQFGVQECKNIVLKESVEHFYNIIQEDKYKTIRIKLEYLIPVNTSEFFCAWERRRELFKNIPLEKISKKNIKEKKTITINNINTEPKKTDENDYEISDSMIGYAFKKGISNIDDFFADFKNYHIVQKTDQSKWANLWRGWVNNYTRDKNNNKITTIDSNMILTDELKNEVTGLLPIGKITNEFEKFKHYYLSNGVKKMNWNSMWKSWCLKYQDFNTSINAAIEQKEYQWNFKLLKSESDKIKNWLEFDMKINWLDKYYWNNIYEFNISDYRIGIRDIMHSTYTKKEHILFIINDSNDSNYLLKLDNNEPLQLKG